MKKKTATSRYDVAEHLRTAEEMAAYLEACFAEADGDAAFVCHADPSQDRRAKASSAGPTCVVGLSTSAPRALTTTATGGRSVDD